MEIDDKRAFKSWLSLSKLEKTAIKLSYGIQVALGSWKSTEFEILEVFNDNFTQKEEFDDKDAIEEKLKDNLYVDHGPHCSCH